MRDLAEEQRQQQCCGDYTACHKQGLRSGVTTSVSGTPDLILRRACGGLKLLLAKFSGADEAVPFDQPFGVVGLAEFEQCPSQFFDRVEGSQPQQIFLQSADEPLGASVALGGTDEGR